MNGAGTPGTYPLISTIGSPRSIRRWYLLWSAVVSACSPETNTMPATLRSSSISTYSSSLTPPGVCVHSTGVYPCCASADSMTCANTGKIGLSSSGTTSPTNPTLRLRSRAGRS